jgi:hypothetical protein
MEALKHYFGITHTRELIARGIEIRRNARGIFHKTIPNRIALHVI